MPVKDKEDHLQFYNHVRILVRIDNFEIYPINADAQAYTVVTDKKPIICDRDDLAEYADLVHDRIAECVMKGDAQFCCDVTYSEAARAAIDNPEELKSVPNHYWVYVSFNHWREWDAIRGVIPTDAEHYEMLLDKEAERGVLENDMFVVKTFPRNLGPLEQDCKDPNDPKYVTVHCHYVMSFISVTPLPREILEDELEANRVASDFADICCKNKKRKLLDMLADEAEFYDHVPLSVHYKAKRAKGNEHKSGLKVSGKYEVGFSIFKIPYKPYAEQGEAWGFLGLKDKFGAEHFIIGEPEMRGRIAAVQNGFAYYDYVARTGGMNGKQDTEEELVKEIPRPATNDFLTSAPAYLTTCKRVDLGKDLWMRFATGDETAKPELMKLIFLLRRMESSMTYSEPGFAQSVLARYDELSKAKLVL